MSSALGQLVLARLRHLLREPEAIFWTFLFPVLLAVALGIAFRGQGPAPTAAVVVAGPGAAPLAEALRARGAIAVEVVDEATALRRLRAGRAAIVVVPGTPLRYRFDPTRPESQLAHATVDAAVQQAAGRRNPVATVDEPVTTPGSRYIDFLVPGLLGMNLMGGGLWGMGWAIVEYRTRKLLKRLLATPMRRRDFLLSHMLARMCFVPLEVLSLLVLTWLLFGVTVAGSVLTLAVPIVIGTLAFAGLGTLLASRARTLEAMSGMINLCTLPMILLSGVFFPANRFPDALQPVIRALPLTALIDGMRGVMTEGASLAGIAPELLVLAVWGVGSFLLALKLFRWT